MSLELVSMLCEIIRLQNEIIERQDEAILQAEIGDAASEDLRKLKREAKSLKEKLKL